MSVSLPNGALVHIASAYAASVVISDITNAATAEATTGAAHGLVEGDWAVVVSGWSRLNGKMVRVGNVPDATHFELEGIDSSNDDLYPAGSGGGTVRKITTFTQLAQILNSSSSGGEQQFLEYQFLEDDAQRRMPTSKTASGLTFTVADDPDLPGYQVAKAANDDRLDRGVRVRLPSGKFIAYNAYISLNETPTLTVNEIMAVECTLSLLNAPVRYAAAA